MNYYCFTIRKCSGSKTIKTLERAMNIYESFIRYIKSLSDDTNIQYHYEYTVPKEGVYNVHLHAMIATDVDNIYLKGKKGYTIKLERIKSIRLWQAYITKNPYTKNQILDLIKALCNKENTYNNVSFSEREPAEAVQQSTEQSETCSLTSEEISDEPRDNIDWTKPVFQKQNI